MHFEGLVFGDNPQELMDSLIQTSSEPSRDIAVPLHAADEQSRSGWHNTNSEHKQDPARGFAYSRAWIRCVWPTAFLRERLGPHALLPDAALTSLELPRHHVQKKDGQWWAEVPRFFSTIGVFWSMTYTSSRGIRSCSDAAEVATVGSLDLEYNLITHDPNLIVGPDGPVFYEGPQRVSPEAAPRRLEAADALMGLSSTTPVTLVRWHDTEPVAPSPWDFGEGDHCACAQRSRAYGWAAQYDEWDSRWR